MLSRRRFLEASSVVSLSPLLPTILGSTARAAAAAPDAKVLVVIQLDGGNDGINTVVPFGDDGYGRARNKLRLETDKLHNLDDHVGLHPNMPAAKELFDDGRLAIVQGVGYPNPDRSHFRSMKIWQTARFDEQEHDGYGWLGRALDRRTWQQDAVGEANAVYVGEQETPVALWGRRSSAMALSRADDLMLQSETTTRMKEASARSDSLEQFVSKQVLSAYAAADEFQRRESLLQNAPTQNYPNTPLGSRLQLVAKLLKSDSQARVFYTMQGGYDTHAAQLYSHSRLLREFADALKAFQDDLQSSKLADRVLTLAFSEFGRRVKENDSQGTDHGTAAPVFLAGTGVQGGLVGHTPDLTDLDSGDLRMNVDFRQLYATILDRWLGVSSHEILDAKFDALPLLRG